VTEEISNDLLQLNVFGDNGENGREYRNVSLSSFTIPPIRELGNTYNDQ